MSGHDVTAKKRTRNAAKKPLTGLLLLSLLAGCAAQKTFDEGSQLVQNGQVEQGLKKMEEAGKMDPDEIKYRTSYFNTREASIQSYLGQADRLVDAKNYQDAQVLFNRVLGIDAANPRAKQGLKRIATQVRHDQWIAAAESALQANDLAAASEKIATLLTEDPTDERALAIQRNITEQTDHVGRVAALDAAYKKQITLQFREATLRQMFDTLSQNSGLNFVFDRDVKLDQKSSIYLKNSSVEAAIYYLLLTNQLGQQVMDANTILIYPNTVAKQKDYQELVVKSFYLSNADVKTVAASLKSILKCRDIVIDERLNMLVMRDTPETIKLAEKIIALHDVAEPEVMLDVAVMEVNRNDIQDLGVQWPNNLTLTPLSASTVISNLPSTGTVTATAASTPLVLTDLSHITSPNVSVGNPSATINAHATDSNANILANPRIRAKNHEKAKIMIGDRVPNITVNTLPTGSSAFVTENITYIDVGLKLEVEPTVNLDNEVSIKIALEVSNIVSQLITKSGTTAYQIGTRNASSNLQLRDGETQILAGLLDDEERHTINKIPSLGDIPILGRLFGSTNDNIQKTDLVLSITPHVIRNVHRPEAAAARFSSGTESNLILRPDFTEGMQKPAIAPQAVAKAKIARIASAPIPVQGVVTKESRMAASAPAVAIIPVPVPESGTTTGPAAPDAAPASAEEGLTLRLSGPHAVQVGNDFSIQVEATSATQIGTLPLTVAFDSALFKVGEVTEGSFLKKNGAESKFNSEIDPRGLITIFATGDSGTGASAGTVATIVLHSLTESDNAQIQLHSTGPLDAGGKSIDAGPDNTLTLHSSK